MNDYSFRVWSRLVAVAGLLDVAPVPAAAASAHGSHPAVCGLQDRNPVLLIHGIHDSARSMHAMSRALTKEGWEVHTLSLAPNDGSLPLEDLAQQVADYVNTTFPPGRKIDLVGFSMGGVVCRYYLQRLDGACRVARFVAVSAPNHGSWLAYLSHKAGCVQMRPGSSFLNDLNEDSEALGRVRFSSIWTPLDLTILPASSSRMPIGKEVKMWVIAHPLMVLSSGCLRAVAEALADPA